MRSRSAVRERAWALHRANGHPPRYDGPCWGPTLAEVEQAAAETRAWLPGDEPPPRED